MNAIERNPFHLSWEKLGQQLPRPRAVLCVSAHWETKGVYLTAASRPETIHDFYGFPKALFDVEYPAHGYPELARRVAELLSGNSAFLDPDRGLDHGAWSVLMPMYPAADVPVVQISLDTGQPGSFHFDLAKKLSPLRDEGVLILASGNIVHNLDLFSFHDNEPLAWAVQFDEEIINRIRLRKHDELIARHGLGRHAGLAIPTPEHYLPLLYALALQNAGEPLSFFNSEVLSSISMTSILIGGLDGF